MTWKGPFPFRGPAGPQGMPGEDAEDVQPVPGPPGATGAVGAAGATGATGAAGAQGLPGVPGFAGEDGEDALMIQGQAGVAAVGAQGVPGLCGEDGEDASPFFACVANSDGTLTLSPTTASLNLAHANTWTAQQTVTLITAPQFVVGYDSNRYLRQEVSSTGMVTLKSVTTNNLAGDVDAFTIQPTTSGAIGTYYLLNVRNDAGTSRMTVNNAGILSAVQVNFTGGVLESTKNGVFTIQSDRGNTSAGPAFDIISQDAPFTSFLRFMEKTTQLVKIMGSTNNGDVIFGTTTTPAAHLHVQDSDSATAAVVTSLIVGLNSTGTPAAGFGVGCNFQLASSTTADQNAGLLSFEWVVATHASRTARGKLSAYDTAARECVRIEASGTAAMIGFLGAAAVVQQTSGANLTNNVTSGGTTDTIADYSDLIIYANDAAAIRNDLYQLARKLKQVNDALRAYGLLS